MAGREKDDDYLKVKDFKFGMDRLIMALESLQHKPPEHFTQLETVTFPLSTDRTKDIPEGTKTLVFFPKPGAFVNGVGLLFNNQLYFELGSVFPFTIPVLPEWKFLTIPMTQPGTTVGQLDFVFSSHPYQDLGSLRGDSVNSDGSIKTTVTGSLANQINFQSTATATGNGTSLTVGGLKNLTVGITSAGGNTARTIEFHGVDAAGNDNLIAGVNKNGLNTATSTTNTGETWQFDITGLVTVYMKLTAITTGSVTVMGLAVA